MTDTENFPETDTMKLKDVEDVARISKMSFSSPWSINAIQEELYNEMAYYLVERQNGRTRGFVGCWIVFDECQITNIAVEESSRRQGTAERLLKRLIDEMKKKDMAVIFLEVRESNTPARKFYEKLGFIYTGLRKRFYKDGEDARLMTLYLK